MKILFVFTGGTIGSTEVNGVADVDGSTAEQIAALCKHEGDVFDFAAPYNILSENATTDTLSDILSYMLSVDYTKYDGIIVTHGSDTAAYTANLLGHALSWVEIPVVITAANYVMSNPHSNASDNLNAAYAFIRAVHSGECEACGVFFAWMNVGEHPHIHAASRLIEADGFSDSFTSYGEHFGRVIAGEFSETYSSSKYLKYTKPLETLSFLKGRKITLTNNVLLLHSYVGLDYENIYIKGKEAVLLKLYHSGTACMGDNSSTSFMYLANMCKKEGVDLYITPAKQGSYIYKSAEGFKATSAQPIYDMSEFSAYAVLLLAYNLAYDEKSKILHELNGMNNI